MIEKSSITLRCSTFSATLLPYQTVKSSCSVARDVIPECHLLPKGMAVLVVNLVPLCKDNVALRLRIRDKGMVKERLNDDEIVQSVSLSDDELLL